MFSPSLKKVAQALPPALLLVIFIPALGARDLRVCADPNNLPFSNQSAEGLENKVADLLARNLGATLTYTWWAERKNFIRDTLDAGRCDLVIGAPALIPGALTTKPLYRSTYVFVHRENRALHLTSFDDPALAHLRIGVQIVGDAYAPPAHALA